MTLLNSDVLWNLVWILPLAVILFYFAGRKRAGLLRRFLGKRADDPAYVTSSPVLRFWRGVIFLAVLSLLVIAAARPSWGMSILPYSGQGRDLMVVFDVSKSMLSQDVRPSRLEHAKWLVRQLCQRNPGDRFGLIAFAGHAFLECPLTIDTTSFLQCADELSPDSIPVGGTNIQQALTEAIRGFRAAETPHRAIILITDGDELTGDSSRALGEIVKLKIPLFILGVGDPSQPAVVQQPDENGGIRTLKDRNGNAVSVPLNEKKLSELAMATGGIYVRSTTTHPGLDQVENRIRQLEKHELDSGKQTRPIERPLYPLLAAFALFCLWLMLGERRFRNRRAGVQILLLAGLLGLAFESAAQTPAAEPPPKEEKEAVQVKGLTPEELYNAGLTAQTQGKDLEKAVQLYRQAIASANASAEVRGRSAQNLGVMRHQLARAQHQQAVNVLRQQQLDQAGQALDSALKQLAESETIYKNALRDAGDSRAIARNQHQLITDRRKIEELKKKIEELKKQQQQARQNTQKAMDQQKKQNQQNQDQKNQKQQDKQKQDKQSQQAKQNQQKQNQQDQQNQQNQDKQSQQKQNQNQQDQQNQQNQSRQQTEQARESVKQLEQQARDLDQKQLEDQAKKAGEELDKARQAQEKKQDKEAEEHLKKALEQLGKEEQNRQDQNKQDKDKQDGQDKDRQKNRQDKPLPQAGQSREAQPVPQEKEIDKDQAETLLELMAGDEKKLKDELKPRMKRNYGTRPVEKDW